MINIHASGVILADRGVVITGPSGSGKSTLALALIARCGAAGIFARLVADDRLNVMAFGDRLRASAPASISGLVEVHGLGPHPIDHEPGMIVDVVARLMPPADSPRFDPGETLELDGIRIRRLDLAERNATAALPAILARLGLGIAPWRSYTLPQGHPDSHDLGLSSEGVSTR